MNTPLGYLFLNWFSALTLEYTNGILKGLFVLSSDTQIHHWDTHWFAGSQLWHLNTPLGYSMVCWVSALTPVYTTRILNGLKGLSSNTWIHHLDTHWFAGYQPSHLNTPLGYSLVCRVSALVQLTPFDPPALL